MPAPLRPAGFQVIPGLRCKAPELAIVALPNGWSIDDRDARRRACAAGADLAVDAFVDQTALIVAIPDLVDSRR